VVVVLVKVPIPHLRFLFHLLVAAIVGHGVSSCRRKPE
jgi:hypothetical protein